MQGTIIKLHHKGGYGFIKPSDGSGDVFFHVRSLIDLEFDDTLLERRVEFAKMPYNGKYRAEQVRPIQ